jgi:glutaredoxin-like protein NrdH
MTVTVYTLPDCIQCEMTKKYLDRHKVEYLTVDMSEDKEASEKIAELGYKQAPVVVYNNFHWSGFRPDKVKALHLLLLNKGIKMPNETCCKESDTGCNCSTKTSDSTVAQA